MQKREHNIVNIIFVRSNHEILLQKKSLDFKRWPGRWSMFGGGIEPDEAPEEALKREVVEELDLKLENPKLFGVFDYADEDRAGKMHVYTAPFVNKLSDISLGEGAGFAFFSWEEIPKLHLIDHDAKILKKYIKTRDQLNLDNK